MLLVRWRNAYAGDPAYLKFASGDKRLALHKSYIEKFVLMWNKIMIQNARFEKSTINE